MDSRAFRTSVLLCLLACAPSHAQLPLDPAVRAGTLDNGLAYYVRRNVEPAGRAQLRLVVDAGSALEDDDQRGLAHFVEHMLFNDTQRLKEGALVDFFERAGMRFGPDLNASTNFEETVYLLELPTGILETGFDVLRDWAAHAVIAPEAVDRERGVLVEEWRGGLGASGRLRDRILSVLLAGSRHADRLPIGDTLTLLQAPPEALRRFYRDWYRPDLMAVVAVGDFDEDRIEGLVRKRFGDLAAPANPRPRPTFSVPAPTGPRYEIVADPELPYTQVEIHVPHAGGPVRTVEDFRDRLAFSLFRGMLNRRFAEIARDGTSSPFLWARITKTALVRNAAHVSLAAQVEEDAVLPGLSALAVEAVRAARHGFTRGEFERQKKQLLRVYERAWRERDNRRSSEYANRYVRHFLTGAATPGIEAARNLASELLPEITLEEVALRAEALVGEENRIVILSMPEKDDQAPAAAEELARTLGEAFARDVAPYVDMVVDEPLLAGVPEAATIASAREIPEFGGAEFTLSNGIRVVAKRTDFREDEILFAASSPGGASLSGDDDYFTTTVADLLVAKSGVGAFGRTQLTKKLSGTFVSVTPFISEYAEGLSGRASPDDLETLFQLIHLYVKAPRVDSAAVASFRNQQHALIVNRLATPGSAFQDSLTAAFFGDWPRRQPVTAAALDGLDAGRALALYADRFADTDDFTFVFVGNFDPDTLRSLSAAYLGSLPATPRQETWRDLEPDLPRGTVVKTARKGRDPQSRTGIVFHGPFRYERAERHRLQSLQAVLDIVLREELREQLGGTYDVSVQAGSTNVPKESYSFSVFFGCDPARADELTRAVFERIEAVRTDADLEDALAKVKEQQRRQEETARETNGYWLGLLRFWAENPAEDPSDIVRYDDLVDALAVEDIREAARLYLGERHVRVTLLPAE